MCGQRDEMTVGRSSQDPIKPCGRFIYEFTLHQEGTYSQLATQEMIGMLGQRLATGGEQGSFIQHDIVIGGRSTGRLGYTLACTNKNRSGCSC